MRISGITIIFFALLGSLGSLYAHPPKNHIIRWTEEYYKKHVMESQHSSINGVYELVNGTYSSARYKVAVHEVDGGKFQVIFLSSEPFEFNYLWSEGDLKSDLYPTATKDLFVAKWFSSDKSIHSGVYAKFNSNGMEIITDDGYRDNYIKLFPTYNSKPSPKINQNIMTGTCFRINSGGYFATNYHVVADAAELNLLVPNQNKTELIPAELVLADEKNDLAIIHASNTKLPIALPYKFKREPIPTGESVFTMGYPLLGSMGNDIKMTNGIISSQSGFKGDRTTYQISAPIQPGNSGGPVFDMNGNIVGIASSKHAGAENVSYAIKTSYLLALIEGSKIAVQQDDLRPKGKHTLAQFSESFKHHIYIIYSKQKASE